MILSIHIELSIYKLTTLHKAAHFEAVDWLFWTRRIGCIQIKEVTNYIKINEAYEIKHMNG